MNPLGIIFNIYLSFFIRRILSRQSILSWNWMSFITLITVSYLVIDYLPIGRIVEKFTGKRSNSNEKDKQKSNNDKEEDVITSDPTWWIKTFLKNASIVVSYQLAY